MSPELSKIIDDRLPKELGAQLKKELFQTNQNPTKEQWAAILKLSEWTGMVYPPQLETLKRTAMLILDAAVVIRLDFDNYVASFEAVNPRGKETVSAANMDRLRTLTGWCLGPQWKRVKLSINGKKKENDSRTTITCRQPAKYRRIKRAKKSKRNSEQ
jgi:hypothetical protein